MSDVLGTPTYLLGIPLADSNVSQPATTGVPIPPWALGSAISGHVYGAHPSLRTYGPPTAGHPANPLGTGRSIQIRLQTDQDGPPAALGGSGAGNAYLQTPATYFGWVPHLGVSGPNYFWSPYVVLIARLTMTTGQELAASIHEYNAAGTEIDSHRVSGITGAAQDTDGEWRSVVLNTTSAWFIDAATRYFKIRLWIDSNGTSTAYWAIDFVGLGFTARSTAQGQLFENYQPDGYDHALASTVDLLEPVGVGISVPFGRSRGITRQRPWAVRFERVTGAFADDMRFQWRAGREHPTDGDNILDGSGGELQGRIWPTLWQPKRPDVKQAFYALPLDPEFPLRVDAKTNKVDETSRHTGIMQWIEQVY